MLQLLQLPDALRSTDFRTFEALYKIMFGAIKKDVNSITDLKDVDKCAEHMLPILAHSIGCEYFADTTPSANRLIIKNWWWLMKNKGTMPAIQTAASLGLIAYDRAKGLGTFNPMYSRSIDMVINTTTGEMFIRIAYQQIGDSEEEQQRWIKRIVDYVRPAGFKIEFVPSQFTHAFINTLTHHQPNILRSTYTPLLQSSLAEEIYYDLNIVEDSIHPDCVAKFGHFNDKSPICMACGYLNECSTYTVWGMGQQEISGLDGEERAVEENNDDPN